MKVMVVQTPVTILIVLVMLIAVVCATSKQRGNSAFWDTRRVLCNPV